MTSSVAVLPLHASTKETPGISWREAASCALHTAAMALGAALLWSAPSAAVGVAVAAAYNDGLDYYADRGVDVRVAGEVTGGMPVHGSAVLGTVVVGALLLHGVMIGRKVLYAHGAPLTRRYRCVEAGVLGALLLFHASAKLARRTRSTAFNATIWLIGLVAFTTLGRHVHAVTGQWLPVRLFVFQCVFFFAWCAFHARDGLVVYFSRDTSDEFRLLWRTLVHPVLAEMCAVPVRLLAAAAPASADVKQMLVVLTLVLPITTLMGRTMITAFESSSMALLCMLGVVLEEMLLRHSAARARDLWALSLFVGRAEAQRIVDSLQGRASRMHVRFLDEALELWATVTAAVLVLAMRYSDRQSGPDAGDAVASAALQIALELGADLLVPVSLAAWRVDTRRRLVQMRRVARGMAGGRRFVAHVALGAAVSLVWMMVISYEPGYQVVVCAWHRPDSGWWIRAPCTLTEGWAD